MCTGRLSVQSPNIRNEAGAASIAGNGIAVVPIYNAAVDSERGVSGISTEACAGLPPTVPGCVSVSPEYIDRGKRRTKKGGTIFWNY